MNKSKKLGKNPDIEAIIQCAVMAGIEAGRVQANRAASDVYKATERRLYALPVLVRKVEDARQRLIDLDQTGPPKRSKDIVRFMRSGVRLSPEEILEALVTDITASIAADEVEIKNIEKALDNIRNDKDYLAVSGRYFLELSDEEIAKQIFCDERTVRRHRGRLVRILAVWLYGAEAV